MSARKKIAREKNVVMACVCIDVCVCACAMGVCD